jgi:hypothetical protein
MIMPWSTVLGKLHFRSATDPWGDHRTVNPTDTTVTSADQGSMTTYLETLYNTSITAELFLDHIDGDILLATDTQKPGHAAHDVAYQYYWTAFSVQKVQQLFYFNTLGALVQERPELTLIHELGHTFGGYVDPQNSSVTQADMNLASFDYQGTIMSFQNTIAREMGWTDNDQVDYYAVIDASVDVRKTLFSVGSSYRVERRSIT